jgi:hypothetical protein
MAKIEFSVRRRVDPVWFWLCRLGMKGLRDQSQEGIGFAVLTPNALKSQDRGQDGAVWPTGR